MKPIGLLVVSILFVNVALCQKGYTAHYGKINPYYRYEFNPFSQTIGLDLNNLPLRRDSIRITLHDNRTVDLFLKDRKLWNINLYDEEGKKVNTGNFKNGNGKITIRHKTALFITSLKNGLLSDTSYVYFSNKKVTYPITVHVFKDGLLEGKSYHYSRIDRTVISSIQHYEKGIMKKLELYGVCTVLIPLPFFHIPRKIKYPNEVCASYIYEKGKVVSYECLKTKNCARCGQ